MKKIQEVSLAGKRVLIRVDFNVPMDQNGHVTDDTRIRSALPTIRYALAQGARIIFASHLGRPKGKPVDAFRLRPAAERLAILLEKTVSTMDDCVGEAVENRVNRLKPGELLMLENLRFHSGETENDDGFARALARTCDVYANDAFAVSHRAHASVEAITRYVPECCAGMLLQKELDYFHQAMADPRRPLVAVIGGAKVSGKLGALENLLARVDKMIVGGAMAHTFFLANGLSTGRSLVELEMVDIARGILKKAAENDIPFFLPVDVAIAESPNADKVHAVVPVDRIPPNMMALDIGPASIRAFHEALQDAGTIVWNGPMGLFEHDAFATGTLAMVEDLSVSSALTIVGGGDTDVAVHRAGKAAMMTYISTGGGAFLALLEGKTLPAVAALDASAAREHA